MNKSEHLVVLVTCPAERSAELASAVVRQGLAACVNILDQVRSIYTWKGSVCDDREALLLIKTSGACFERLRKKIVELHPYEVPEVIAVPVVAGHAPYLSWISQAMAAAPVVD